MSFAHLHLLLNHFPVIGAILAIALLGFAVLRRNDVLGRTSLWLFGMLGVVSVAVYFTGGPAEEAIEKLPGFSEAITERHEESAQVATIAFALFGAMALGALAFFRKKSLPRSLMLGAFVLSIVAGGMMGYTALLGGQVRHTEIRSVAPVTSAGGQENPD